MSKYMVKHGATLTCSYGSCPGKIKATRENGAKLKEENEAVITDFIPGINIPCFGICSSPLGGGACVPMTIMPWLLGKEDVYVGNVNALMDDSILPCLRGGIISIEEHGQ